MWALRARHPQSPPAPGAAGADLLPLVNELHAALDPEELFVRLGAGLRRGGSLRGLALYVPEPDGSLRRLHAEGEPLPAARLGRGEALAGAAADRGTPLSRRADGLREMAVPLRHGERLVGVLSALEPADHAASELEPVLHALATPLAVALDNAQRHREARWYAGLLATLYDIGKETASILELDELLARVAEVVKRVIDYEMFGILLLDEESGDLVLRKSVSYGAIPEKTRIRMGEGLCGTAAATKQAVLVGDVSADPRYLNWIPHTRSELAVPLLHKDRLVGVFDLESSELHRFTEEHLKVLTPLASQVAVAIENARLVDALVETNDRLEREMAIARRVQHGLFPEECPSGQGWEASASFRPARELGGDLYDFYDLEPSLLGLAVGDVSGKGVPAALYGAFATGTVRARAFERLAPAQLLYRVNRTLRRRGVEGLYCTLAYALFDFAGRTLRLANSGLPYPLHYQARTGRCREVEIPGLPLGSFDDSRYEEQDLPLEAGDVFVFFSDGVVEAASQGEEYGIARLSALVEARAALAAPALGEAILEDLHRFLGDDEPSDDVTVVVVKVRP
jgi:sigma-B regulation protein RsbU (phosphoserine phosphatase)